jgi:hypothetical protein
VREGIDDGLRRIALEVLGPVGQPLAREALEVGALEVHPHVLTWQGSLGVVSGHLVVLWLDPDLCESVRAVPSATDALTAAVAAAVARVSGNALAELKILPRGTPPPSSPYRG